MVRTIDFALINIVLSALCMVFERKYSSEICCSSVEISDNNEKFNDEDISDDNIGGKLMKD